MPIFRFLCCIPFLWASVSTAQCVTNINATIIVGTWTEAGSPYCVQNDVQVASLIIEPGVHVYFLENFEFRVTGTLTAIGSPDKKIVFDKDEGASEWRGIRFDATPPGSELAHAIVQNATSGGVLIEGVFSPPILRDCEIVNNSIPGMGGGGIRITDSGLVTIERCLVSANTSHNMGTGASTGAGGGIYAAGSLKLVHSVIENNQVSSSGSTGGTKHARGGGIYVDGSLELEKTIVRKNEVFFSGWNSSLRSHGGGIYVVGDASLVNSAVSQNVVDISTGGFGTGLSEILGGGIYVSGAGSELEIINTTVQGHAAGGGVHAETDTVASTMNSIFWDNNMQISGDGLLSADYSIIQGGFAGTGNLNFNPIFVDSENDPALHLSFGSPALGVADCSTAPAEDIDGESRPSFSGCDMGADELSQSFNDVPPDYWAAALIEALKRKGTTRGCSDTAYCPESPVNRAQMALFITRELRGQHFVPPPATGNVFTDVSATDFAAATIEEFFRTGITQGCGNNQYCPNQPVTRAQMAVFLLRALYGADHTPPVATGVFGDVPINHWAAPWIEQLADQEITLGCGGSNFCPDSVVTRAQMAVFLIRTFGFR